MFIPYSLFQYLENLPSLFPTSHVGDGSDVEQKENEDDKTSSGEGIKAYNREENLRKWIDEYCRSSRAHVSVGELEVREV